VGGKLSSKARWRRQNANPDVASDILRSLRGILHSITLHSKALARDSGLTLPQLAVLRTLYSRDRAEATIVEIARGVEVSSPTVTGIVDRLERLMMVERVRGTEDRRKVYVRLTDLGRQRVESLAEQPQDKFIEGVTALDPFARDVLLTSLKQILEMMETPPDFEPAPFLVPDETLEPQEH